MKENFLRQTLIFKKRTLVSTGLCETDSDSRQSPPERINSPRKRKKTLNVLHSDETDLSEKEVQDMNKKSKFSTSVLSAIANKPKVIHSYPCDGGPIGHPSAPCLKSARFPTSLRQFIPRYIACFQNFSDTVEARLCHTLIRSEISSKRFLSYKAPEPVAACCGSRSRSADPGGAIPRSILTNEPKDLKYCSSGRSQNSVK